jgi:hypothetical protein
MLLASPPPATPPPASFPQWGDVPTWGLLALAAITAVFAFFAFRKQSEEVRALKAQVEDQHQLTVKQTPVLELQTKELEASLKQREDEAAERHRAHARMISVMLGPNAPASKGTRRRIAIDLINGSAEPVYGLVVGLVYIQGAGPAVLERWLEIRQKHPDRSVPITTVSILPAGDFRIWITDTYGLGIPSGRLAAEVAFTDRNNVHWIRRATGQLEELNQEPLRHFAELGFYGPHALLTPQRITSFVSPDTTHAYPSPAPPDANTLPTPPDQE